MRKTLFILAFFMLMATGTAFASGNITSLTAIGAVREDGARLEAIVLDYDSALTSVSASDYETEGEIETVSLVHTDTGSQVTLTIKPEPLSLSEQSFLSTMSVHVRQVNALDALEGTVPPQEICNYTEKETYNSFRGAYQTTREPIWGTYKIKGIEGFKYFTSLDTFGQADGPAFQKAHCFSEITGLYSDVALSYALFVPEDYNPEGRYALVTIENPAAAEGTHPLQSVLETRSPALMASAWAQDLVREKHGLDGLIVVVPTVTERVDDNGCTPAQYEAIAGLWDYLLAEYPIDPDHVYGMGQSVGGMILLETNRNRDNFFQGVIMFENQWVQNYYKDTLFARNIASDPAVAAAAPMHYPRTDAGITWDYHYENGEKVTEGHDPCNFYYLVSDDNVLVMNRSMNKLSNGAWQELSYLYEDLAGIAIPHFYVDANAPVSEQESKINSFLSEDSPLGIRIVTFVDGANGYSARKVLSGYEWLLSQDRPEREKLDINRPFALAETQLYRPVEGYTGTEGQEVSYMTAKAGSGTQLYNSSWLNLVTVLDAEPGWLPEGMSWENGVTLALIEQVEASGNTVTITYSDDMTGSVLRLKGEEAEGRTIVMDPYDLYDKDGEAMDVSIVGFQADGGKLMLTLDREAEVGSIIQRTTIRSDRSIASASAKRYEVTQ